MHLLKDYPGYDLEVGANFAVRPTGKARFYQKDGKAILCVELLDTATQTRLYLCVQTPLAPIAKALSPSFAATKSQVERLPGLEKSNAMREASAQLEGDWLDSVLDKAKGIAKNKLASKVADTLKSPAFQSVAKAAGKKALAAVKNPTVQKFAMYSAAGIATSFGVPPTVTTAAAGVLTRAMAGSAADKAKVAAIAQKAAQGDLPAKALKGAMDTLYKNGLSLMEPYLQQALKEGANRNPAVAQKWLGYAQQALPLAQKAGWLPLNLGDGVTAIVGGFADDFKKLVYHQPFRSPVQYRLGRNLGDFWRGAYHRGIQVSGGGPTSFDVGGNPAGYSIGARRATATPWSVEREFSDGTMTRFEGNKRAARRVFSDLKKTIQFGNVRLLGPMGGTVDFYIPLPRSR